MLSDAQFGGLAEEAKAKGSDDGGFTINHETGHRPTKGFSVSLAGSERAIPTYSATSGAIKGYAQRHHDSLRTKGTYLGAWTPARGNQGHGNTHLDNSRVRRSKKSATNEMVMENQEAMYHLDEGKTIPNVFRQKPTTFTEPAGFDRAGFERDVADLYRRHNKRQTLSADEATRSNR